MGTNPRPQHENPSTPPSWSVKLSAGRAAAWASLTEQERADALAERQARREASAERKRDGRERARRINAMSLDGATPTEIAKAEGISLRQLWKLRETWGLTLSGRAGMRRLLIWITDTDQDALDRLAEDMDHSRLKAARIILASALCDDATPGRRDLRVRRKVAGAA